MRERFPQVRLQVFESSAGQIDQWISSGFVDVGLTFRYGQVTTPDCEHLVTVGSYLMGAPSSPLLRGDEVKFAQLDDLPLVLPGAPSRVRLLLDQLAKREGISLRVVLEADSTQIQKAVAATEGVYTILPRHAAAADIANGKLRASRIVQPSMKRMIVMGLTAARPASLATTEVARMVRSLFRSGVAGKMIVPDLSADD
jgi:DNA-binding transcriptional LysR family regulator